MDYRRTCKMKKTATITFHAAHNYGSNLQAYALQQTLFSLGYDNKIINLRTPHQKDAYAVFTKRRGLKYIFKNLSHLLYYRELKKAHKRFEEFINSKLVLTKEYSSCEDLMQESLDFDCYIAGSDQIWNPIPLDFDWAYYLTFVKNGKKISYAPSFGQLASVGDSLTTQRIATELSKFDVISVREQGAADNVKKMLGASPSIVLDPTLLIPKEHWLSLVEHKERIIEGDYIFFYTLFADRERLHIVKEISKKINIPIVTSNFSNQYDVINPFIKCYDAGPLEFLTLIRDAKFVVASSFHGTVFSILLNTPFFAINGMQDARIRTLLEIVGLEERSVSSENVSEKCEYAYDIDFMAVNQKINEVKSPSIDYLKNSIGITHD